MDHNCPLSPGAQALCDLEGWTAADAYSSVMLEIQEIYPTLLIGGYNVDTIVVATYLEMGKETHEDGRQLYTHEQIIDMICSSIEMCYGEQV